MTAGYPDFIKSTGYGDVAGLSGINCRHSFGAYFPGISTPPPSEEELAEQRRRDTTTKPYTFKNKKGEEVTKEYTYYEATQEQRRQERLMRDIRKQAAAMKAAGITEEHTALKARYRAQTAEYKRFSEAMGIIEQRERVYMDGLGRVF